MSHHTCAHCWQQASYGMAKFQISSMVRRYHAYKDVWQASSGDILHCGREVSNRHDPYAVAVNISGVIVGHVPRRILTICSLLLRRGGLIQCTVTGSRRHSEDLPQGGLKIPCGLTFKIEIKDVLEKTQNLPGRVSRKEARALRQLPSPVISLNQREVELKCKPKSGVSLRYG